MTLWDQKGSGVIRGKLVVIPIEKAFLYVVPLYLKAEGTNFPQLMRVIAATGSKVVMEPTLDEALSSLLPPDGVHPTASKAPIGSEKMMQARAQLIEIQTALDSPKALMRETAKDSDINVCTASLPSGPGSLRITLFRKQKEKVSK